MLGGLLAFFMVVFVLLSFLQFTFALTNSKVAYQTIGADETVTSVTRNQLGRDLIAEKKQEVSQQINEERNQILDQVAVSTPISTYFADDISAWKNADGTINSLNSEIDISGAGTEENPYIIKTVKGFVWFVYKSTYPTENAGYVYAELNNDIDFSGLLFDIGVEANESGNVYYNGFIGSIDGKGFGLKNLIITGFALFNGLGVTLNLDIGEMNFWEGDPVVIKNMSIDVCTENSSFGMTGSVCLFGNSIYNTTLNNVNIDLFYYGLSSDMNCIITLYQFGGTIFQDCLFDYRGSEYFQTFAGFVSGEIMGVSLQKDYFVIDGCESIMYFITESGGDRIASNFAPTIIAGGFSISNSIARGFVYSNARASGAFLGSISSDMGATFSVDIENCENYTIFAGQNDIGGIVGEAGAYKGSVIINISNCKNFGDLYCVGTSDVMAVGGIVGQNDHTTQINITGCENYGNIYSGTCQGGIMGLIDTGMVTITNCFNYGNLCYPLAGIANVYFANKLWILPTCALSGGIACIKQGSATIVGCGSMGSFVSYTQQEEVDLNYQYDLSSPKEYNHSGNSLGCAGILIHGAFYKDDLSYYMVSNISIKNCIVVSKATNSLVVGGAFVQLATKFDNEGTSLTIEETFVTLKLIGTYLTDEIFNVGLAGYEGGDPSPTAEFVTIRNCYFESNGGPNAFCLSLGATKSITVENFACNIICDLKNDSASFGKDFFAGMLNSPVLNLNNLSFNYVFKNASFNSADTLFASTTLETIKMATNCVVNLVADNNVEQAEFKKYIHNGDDANAFGSDDWFYAENMNDELPQIKCFYHIGEYFNNIDVLNKLLQLGFTKYQSV